MTSVVLIIHLIVAMALVAMVLLQRSEGGALGIGGGGGGGGGGMFAGRGAGNLLTRSTAVLAAVFFSTSILLTILARQELAPTSAFDGVENVPGSEQPADTPGNVDLPDIGTINTEPAEPQVPVSE